MLLDRILETGLLPDPLVRAGIRRLLRQRLQDEAPGSIELLAIRIDALGLRCGMPGCARSSP